MYILGDINCFTPGHQCTGPEYKGILKEKQSQPKILIQPEGRRGHNATKIIRYLYKSYAHSTVNKEKNRKTIINV